MSSLPAACEPLLRLRSHLITSSESETLLLQLGVELARLLELERRHELLLDQVRAADRLHLQRQALEDAPVDYRQGWMLRHWKTFVRQQLALTLHVRPLVYADLRSRVRSSSATYGRPAGPALRAIHSAAAQQLYHQHMELSLADEMLAASLYDELRACGAELA